MKYVDPTGLSTAEIDYRKYKLTQDEYNIDYEPQTAGKNKDNDNKYNKSQEIDDPWGIKRALNLDFGHDSFNDAGKLFSEGAIGWGLAYGAAGVAEFVYDLAAAYALAEFIGFLPGAISTGIEAIVSNSVTSNNSSQLTKAFHFTTEKYVSLIEQNGLRPGSYATPTEGLSPLQAHIELALNPAGGARNTVMQIDIAGLREAGYIIPGITRVTNAFGMAGGGWEMQFCYAIPPEFIKVITQ